MSYLLPELEYSYNALEPHFDAETMKLHHTKHHAAYLNKFNKAIEGTELENKSPQEIFSTISEYPDAVRNNGGGYFNHALFWQLLTPNHHEGLDTDLEKDINKYFGSLQAFKDEFSNAAKTLFGSGWTWLIKTSSNRLEIITTQNQDNPLMDCVPVDARPLLCLDVWEHAYYLRYKNSRPDYINAFWNVVNWDKVASLYHSYKPVSTHEHA